VLTLVFFCTGMAPAEFSTLSLHDALPIFYQREWIGIRPRRDAVLALSPLPLDWAPLHGDKWLFWARVPDADPQSSARAAASASRATSPAGRAHAAGFGAS